jgi:phospholipase/carboxylesterase
MLCATKQQGIAAMDDTVGMRAFDGIEREIGDQVDLSIIWLHGLGADASDFLPIIGELTLPSDTRFVFPNAPLRPITINGGMVMRGWYDIAGFGSNARADVAGLMQSTAIVKRLIERELERGVACERIVLAGFSQGGAVVLHAGLTADRALGGILGLSTYLPAPELLRSASRVASDTPVMLAHGTHDQVIPIAIAEQSAEALRACGVTVDWSTYPMGHEVNMDEIRAISAWLTRFGSR